MTTAKESRHMARVAALGCVVCDLLGYGATEACVHHIREGRIARNHFLTLPLCREHHVGDEMSVHQAKPALMRALKMGSEFELLAVVMEKLER